MKRIAILPVILLAASCQQPERQHRDQPSQSSDTTLHPTTSAQLSTADVNLDGKEKAFILSTHNKNILIKELAHTAQNSNDRQIKSFSQQVFKDFAKLTKDLSNIANGKGVLLDTKLSKDQLAELENFKVLDSETFTRQYLLRLQNTQAALTQLYLSATELSNNELKLYAKNALRTIHDQQARITQLISKPKS